ncbi:unnamed protein product [Caenorhabditis angaria]|uniref:CUB-like domain-containing protein n=1 Tax=Caenorhabditis angaria TaxID=860376 RepID=A0A9P1J4A4_9PELO|nr:unnamed protein product [Caenorhabditis angaria]
MFKTGILLLLIFTTGVQSDCQCFQNTVASGRSVSVNNAFDTTNFQPCYTTPCGFIAYSGNDALGWNNVSITWNTIVDPTAILTIYDGIDEKATVLAILKPENSPSSISSSFQSSTASIFVKYTQTIVTSGNIYYGSVQATRNLSGTTSPASPTATPMIF